MHAMSAVSSSANSTWAACANSLSEASLRCKCGVRAQLELSKRTIRLIPSPRSGAAVRCCAAAAAAVV
eukprot:2531720-Alexandrium_andersonii.AAC.1